MHSLQWYREIVFNQMTDETMIAKMKIIAIIIYYGKREQKMRYKIDIGTILYTPHTSRIKIHYYFLKKITSDFMILFEASGYFFNMNSMWGTKYMLIVHKTIFMLGKSNLIMSSSIMNHSQTKHECVNTFDVWDFYPCGFAWYTF